MCTVFSKVLNTVKLYIKMQHTQSHQGFVTKCFQLSVCLQLCLCSVRSIFSSVKNDRCYMVLYFTVFFGLKLMGLFNLVVILELHGQKVLYFKFLSLYKTLSYSSKFNLLTGTCLIIEKCETKLIPRLTLNFDNTYNIHFLGLATENRRQIAFKLL